VTETITSAQYRSLAAQTKRNKYRAQPITVDGIRFASKAEATRFQTLMMYERGGMIEGLEAHPKFELFGRDGSHIGFYSADSSYVICATGQAVVEDVKSPITARTAAFRRTLKLMRATWGIEVKVYIP
jgi:hypothetical protein